MGLFDFPRIHFKGNIDINVPTINNSYYFPLTIYDQTQSRAFLPPRLYFSTAEKANAVNSNLNPKPTPVQDVNGYWYIEITPINTIDLLRTWCMTPLGTVPTAPDNDYVPYYQAADNDLGQTEGAHIMGNCPGYWNMYGDMSVSMTDVEVTGVQTFDGTQISTWTQNSNNPPPSVAPLLSASFDLDTQPGSGISSALMVETISSQSVYANVFCSHVNLYDPTTGKAYLKGRPFRFSALIYSAWRVVNWFPAMSGSARFCSTILLNQLDDAGQTELNTFFNANNAYDGRMLKGYFVTFTILEVFENRYDQNFYINNGAKINPAQATTIGSITPWYEGDMLTGVAGRNLISLNMNPVYTNTGSGGNIPVSLTPAISSLRTINNGSAAIFSIDMGNTWPEIMTPAYQFPKVMPAKRGDATFQTLNLGNLSLRYGPASSTEFASLAINPATNPLETVAQTGCIFDFMITDPSVITNVQNNFIQAYINVSGTDKQVLQESTYMITTDQKGLYAYQGDSPGGGYFVYNDQRIPCQLRIFQRGLPVTVPINVYVAEYIVPEAANDPLAGPDNVTVQSLADNGVVALASGALQLTNNAVYYFVYDGQYPNNQIPVFSPSGYTVMDTGSFACLRVHPLVDYSQYLDPTHPNYRPPTFEDVYNEVFQLYDVVYPAMALLLPFTQEVWDNGSVAGLVLQRIDMAQWPDFLYMPRSRELGPSQRQLLQAWAKRYK
jgi:hypothetical protein